MNGRKQIGKDGEQGKDGFGNTEVKDHDAVERAVDGHQRHGDGGVDEGKLKSFEEHGHLLNRVRAFDTPCDLNT